MVRLNNILDKVREYSPGGDLELINRAYVYSAKAHAGAVRLSGEPYLVHPLEVAWILCELKMDPVTIAVGLLHDTLEDTGAKKEEMVSVFGEEVTLLVEALTKISLLHFENKAEQQAENLRRMIISMAKDVRVIMVKLADRLHNMRTLEHLRPDKQVRVARETMDIYAPLANRLGIAWIKGELEDLSFRYLNPEAFRFLEEKVRARRKEYDAYTRKVIKVLEKALADHGLKGEVTGRRKHIWSIHKKMVAQNLTFEQIYDLIAFRIILDSVKECYEGLGVIHSLFTPIPGRFKDYIGIPKSNGYQSLHTTVIGPVGEQMEVQIRTREMHQVAEEGIAAHWHYKEGKAVADEDVKRFSWFKQMVEELREVKDPRELMDTVKLDLFPDEVYVFTPKGDVRRLPQGSTPIDFAYGIHTDVGHWCVGAKVNGRMVPLKYQLRNGDIVEVITQKTHRPSKDWLKMVVTNRAKSKIRAFIKQEERERSVSIGQELLDRELRKMDSGLKKVLKGAPLLKAAQEMGYNRVEDLIAGIGYGKVSARSILGKLFPPEEIEKVLGKGDEGKGIPGGKTAKAAAKDGILIDGIEDIMVRYAQCCNPLPGDDVVGIVTRGRGISVHTMDCPNVDADRFNRERMVPVKWDNRVKVPRLVRIRVTSEDKKGLLADMTAVISEQNVNINNADIRTDADHKATNTFEVEVENLGQLQQLIRSLAGIKGVISVQRVKSQ